MSLPQLVLDDLTWETLTDAARRRIPAASAGVWTLHAPVDPGITLLELLAYLLEQRLYWLDQVPGDLVLAALDLLGADGPRPARPAGTVLRLAVEAAPDDPEALDRVARGIAVPAGTVLSRDPVQEVTFTLAGDVTVLPLAAGPEQVLAGGRDRIADLRAGRGVAVLGADGEPGEVRLVFERSDTTRRPETGTALTLLLELDTPAGSPPSWHPGAVPDVPPPAALTWHWYEPGGPEWPVAEVDDGTAGLRRSGVVTLRLPDAWCGAGASPDRYGLRIHTAAATWSQPPVLRQAVPNAAAAEHAEAREATGADLGIPSESSVRSRVAAGRSDGESWRRLPGQRLDLPGARGRLLTSDLRIRATGPDRQAARLTPSLRIRRGGTGQDWTAVSTFAFSGPGDRVFTVDRDAGALRFGDGLTGAVPVPDEVPGAVVVRYALGGGETGNGGRTANWLAVRQPDPQVIISAANVVPAAGGRDPETVEQARARVAGDLARVRRAVTAEDFGTLARGTEGMAVARCHVAIGAHPGYPCAEVPGAVSVRILPAVNRDDRTLADPAYVAAVRPDPGMLAAVRARLDRARLLGTEVYVGEPRYRTVRLRVDVRGRPADPAAIRAALRLALRRYLDPLAGGDDEDGWPFGAPLRPTALVRVAQTALGDAAEVTAVAVGLDGAEPADDCTDTALRDGELPALESTALRVIPMEPGPTGGGW
ncbi:putative baseplate assembly protein [Actinoplanes sp. ATCC 53533]|uniref:putative baseplate assembly protein n=1 Tax=Actinoplanes sp. ATCC 53533 TaxID=1288362 RepID=UPI000F7A7CD9|nr:putative baseplate assembly protein [Actinoplanes sp. ATCC 53533]RSM64734.1 putative baseplate assembly protein [Actinoplanes sp. ATCC 53533]